MPWWAPWRRWRRRLNPPSALDGLSDELVFLLFSRAPFSTHGTLHVVNRRLKNLLRSSEFRQQRVECGTAEYGLVLAAGVRHDLSTITECSMMRTEFGLRRRDVVAWRPIAPLSGEHSFGCSAILENEDGQPEMWVMGGMFHKKWADLDEDLPRELATVEAYNLRTNTWRSCLPLSQPRFRAVAGVVGGRLVVAGGYADDGGILTSVEAYSPTGWTPLPPLPHATRDSTASVLDGRLYVMGGLGRGAKKLQVLEFSEEDGFSWTVKADLPAARDSAASAAAVDGKLWLMGGVVKDEEEEHEDEESEEDDAAPRDRGPASVVVYDVQNDTWATGPELPRGILSCDAQILAGEVYVTGENDSGESMTFRSGTHGWEQVPSFNDGQGMRHGAMRQSLLLG